MRGHTLQCVPALRYSGYLRIQTHTEAVPLKYGKTLRKISVDIRIFFTVYDTEYRPSSLSVEMTVASKIHAAAVRRQQQQQQRRQQAGLTVPVVNIVMSVAHLSPRVAVPSSSWCRCRRSLLAAHGACSSTRPPAR